MLKIFISKSVNPFLNLAFEEYIFKTCTNLNALFLYKNDSCLVLGRNQNPWKEIDFTALNNASIPLVRRNSGGGTVYHDLGNTNYCYMMDRDSFHRKTSVELVCKALRRLNIPAEVNHRYDIEIDGRKVSGSAYKLVSTRAYHHGTMLIGSNLSLLTKYLNPKKKDLVGGGIASVPAPVTKLSEYSAIIDHDLFCDALVTEFTDAFGREGSDLKIWDDSDVTPEIEEVMARLQSYEWVYGQTPKFVLTINLDAVSLDKLEIKVENSIITQLVLNAEASVVKELGMLLIGKRLSDLHLIQGANEGLQEILQIISRTL